MSIAHACTKLLSSSISLLTYEVDDFFRSTSIVGIDNLTIWCLLRKFIKLENFRPHSGNWEASVINITGSGLCSEVVVLEYLQSNILWWCTLNT